jgi:hypothetical protein
MEHIPAKTAYSRFVAHFLQVLLVAAVLMPAPTLSAETYIIPIWATNLAGSDGSWWAQATATNPTAVPVSFSVSRVFPLQMTACDGCSGESASVTLEPFASRVIQPSSGLAGRRLTAGAFEVTASGPLNIHVVAYRPGSAEIRQRLDVARRWLAPGSHLISTVERGAAWRVNVFLTNPGDAPLTVRVWTGSRELNEVRVTIGPRATSVISLPPPNCGNGPESCPPHTTEFPPKTLRVGVEGDGEFLASVSSVDPDWAVFSIADEALQ